MMRRVRIGRLDHSEVTACADEVIVWKDVDGMLTADPRAVGAARPVPAVSFEEARRRALLLTRQRPCSYWAAGIKSSVHVRVRQAAELAHFGASILHPTAMLPAMGAGIAVRVKNSYNPSHPGTVRSAPRRRRRQRGGGTLRRRAFRARRRGARAARAA